MATYSSDEAAAFTSYRTARARELTYFKQQQIRSQRLAAGTVSAVLLAGASIICVFAMPF